MVAIHKGDKSPLTGPNLYSSLKNDSFCGIQLEVPIFPPTHSGLAQLDFSLSALILL